MELDEVRTKYEEPILWHTSILHPARNRFPDLIERLIKKIDSARKSTKGLTKSLLQKEATATAWFIEALYQSYFCIPRSFLAFPLGKNASSSKLFKSPVPYATFKRIVQAANQLGWIEIKLGYKKSDISRVTLFRSQGELEIYFNEKDFEWNFFCAPNPENSILISYATDKKIRRVATETDSNEVEMWKHNLNLINNFLLKQCIFLDAPNELIAEAGKAHLLKSSKRIKGRGSPINFQSVTLRRIFSRNTTDLGGRFYGGWWQSVAGKHRKHVSINGNITVEADFSGMALNCLYAIEGARLSGGDAYDIGINYSHKKDPRRKSIKNFTLAILSDEKGTFRLPKEELNLIGMSHAQLLKRVRQKHEVIQHHFYTGIGLRLQKLDSIIAEQVMLQLLQLDKVCLPVHDSFIVQFECADLLVQVMKKEYEKILKQSIEVDREEVFVGEGFAVPSPTVLVSSSNEDEFFEKHNHRNSIAMNYITSWTILNKTPSEISNSFTQALLAWDSLRRNI